MISEERLLKVLQIPHISEKASAIMRKNNIFVLKVIKRATKIEIRDAIQNIFKVEVKNVNTLVVKGKIKRHGQHIGRCKNWKKAYVTLKRGYNLNFLSNTE